VFKLGSASVKLSQPSTTTPTGSGSGSGIGSLFSLEQEITYKKIANK